MDVEIILKIAVVGIIVAVLNQVLSKAGRDDYALITALAGVVVVLVMLIPHLETLLDSIKSIFNM
ncbi:MAG: stage III sporulation protein AC [Oscillospiraceae bacterium]|nr:stage III sporulation protein AC [Oscillospiraceae bacterium]